MAAACSLLIVALGGCSPTEQAHHVKPSGFLSDYSRLRPGERGEPLLVYLNPGRDFRAYDKVLVDPVTVWKSPDSTLANVPPQDLEHLAILLEARIIEAARHEGLDIVRQPGPGVMRIRAALTEAEQSSVKMDIATSVVPLPSFTKLATGTRAFVGKASIEGEIQDSQSGMVLAAMVDRRAGGRSPEGIRDSWHDVEQAFQFWSDRLAYRLCQLRGGTTLCVPP